MEIVKEAVANAKENAKLNEIGNVGFILADASKNMDDYLTEKDIVYRTKEGYMVYDRFFDLWLRRNYC